MDDGAQSECARTWRTTALPNQDSAGSAAQAWVSIGFRFSILALGGALMMLRACRFGSTAAAEFEQHCHVCSSGDRRKARHSSGWSVGRCGLGTVLDIVTALPDHVVQFADFGALIGLLPKKGVAALSGFGELVAEWCALWKFVCSGGCQPIGKYFGLKCVCGPSRYPWKNRGVRFVMAYLIIFCAELSLWYALHMVLYRLFYHPLYLLAVLLAWLSVCFTGGALSLVNARIETGAAMSLRIEQLSYRYPNGDTAVIDQGSAWRWPQAKAGHHRTNGLWKSTLLRLIVGSLQRHGQGQVGGEVH